VISWFQAFAFKWVNLRRYCEANAGRKEQMKVKMVTADDDMTTVGLCTS
jgi:hypothetical protein